MLVFWNKSLEFTRENIYQEFITLSTMKWYMYVLSSVSKCSFDSMKITRMFCQIICCMQHQPFKMEMFIINIKISVWDVSYGIFFNKLKTGFFILYFIILYFILYFQSCPPHLKILKQIKICINVKPYTCKSVLKEKIYVYFTRIP